MSDLGNKEIFSKNLKYYMQINNKTRNDICKDLGFIYTTFAEWYNGRIYPRIDKIELMADYFGIKKSDLIENKDKGFQTSESVIISVYGTIPAGIPMELIEDIIDSEEIPSSMLRGGKQYFGLKIKGNSMFPEYKNGDIIICEKTEDCENGEDCVVMVNGYDGTFKKVYKNENGIILQPINSAYSPVSYTNDQVASLPVKIIGRAVELRRKK